MGEIVKASEIIELTGYDGDPSLVTVIGIDLERYFICFYSIPHILSSQTNCHYYKLLPQDGAWKITNQDITWEIEWENLMN